MWVNAKVCELIQWRVMAFEISSKVRKFLYGDNKINDSSLTQLTDCKHVLKDNVVVVAGKCQVEAR